MTMEEEGRGGLVQGLGCRAKEGGVHRGATELLSREPHNEKCLGEAVRPHVECIDCSEGVGSHLRTYMILWDR